jgi:MOSC domain-containing protein YiiM
MVRIDPVDYDSQSASTGGLAATSPQPIGHIESINVGRPRNVPWHDRVVTTAIWKEPVKGRIAAAGVNLDGDDQADRRVHGGPTKSIYAYAIEDYHWWAGQLAFVRRFAEAARPGAYLAIERAGDVKAGDPIHMLDRPRHQVTIGDVERAYHGHPELLPMLVDLEDLTESWRDWARRHLERTSVERD